MAIYGVYGFRPNYDAGSFFQTTVKSSVTIVFPDPAGVYRCGV